MSSSEHEKIFAASFLAGAITKIGWEVWQAGRDERTVNKIFDMNKALEGRRYQDALKTGRSISLPRNAPANAHAVYHFLMAQACRYTRNYADARENFVSAIVHMMQMGAASATGAIVFSFLAETCLEEWTNSGSQNPAGLQPALASINNAIKYDPSDSSYYALRTKSALKKLPNGKIC